jgi:Protein of unknown function (DUF3570)
MSLRQSVLDARPSVSCSRASTRLRRPCVAFALAFVCLLLSTSCASSGIRTADAALYVRADTNDIVVYAPRTHVGAKVGDGLMLDATYAVDVWTGASIDVVTAATTAITEVRQEANAGVGYEFKDVTLSGSYRYSTENDYWSNGGVLNLMVDLFDNNTTLGVSAIGSMDKVGKAHDPTYPHKPQDSIGGRLTFSQVLDTKTVLSASAEMIRLTGFLASPYRMVGLGVPGLCGGISGPMQSLNCLPENHPHERLRTALALRLRRAFGSHVSMGVDYRYYFDDWGIGSHTPSLDLAILLGAHGTLSFSYRFYIQSRSDFYEERYVLPAWRYHYFSRDRKMSAMSSHHAGLEYVHNFDLSESGNAVLTLGLRAGWTRFIYTEFVGLTTVDALETTGALGVLFR